MTTPGFSGALQQLNQGITNQVNDQFAAAGRDLSPGNTQALATGLSQGEGQLLANQYNQNAATQQAAINQAFGGANSTASGLTQQQLAQIQANTGGLGVAGSIPQLALQPGSAQLSAASQAAQQPYTNLSWLSSLALPIGALGSSSSGTSTGTTTQNPSLLSNLIGGGLGIGSLFAAPAGGTSAAAGIGSALSSLGPLLALSDERVKDDIVPIGMLYDSTPIYSYRYKPEIDPTGAPRIGVMAQDIEKTRPDAVVEVGGIKAVDYAKATEGARYLGMLSDMAA